MADKKKVEIRSRVLHLITEKQWKAGEKEGNREALHVIQWWYKDEKSGEWKHSEKLERRGFFNIEDKDTGAIIELSGKAKGLTVEDLSLVKGDWKKIIHIMQNPPIEVPAAPEGRPSGDKSSAKTDTNLEEVPF